MSTWGLEGTTPLADFTKTVAEIVLDLFNNQANWTESTVGWANILFTSSTYDGTKFYTVAVKSLSQTNQADVLGSTSYEYTEYVNVHIWVKSLQHGSIPGVEIQAMKSMIEQICAQKRTNVGQGIRYIGIPEWSYSDTQDDQDGSSLYHVVGRVLVEYRKVSTI